MFEALKNDLPAILIVAVGFATGFYYRHWVSRKRQARSKTSFFDSV